MADIVKTIAGMSAAGLMLACCVTLADRFFLTSARMGNDTTHAQLWYG